MGTEFEACSLLQKTRKGLGWSSTTTFVEELKLNKSVEVHHCSENRMEPTRGRVAELVGVVGPKAFALEARWRYERAEATPIAEKEPHIPFGEGRRRVAEMVVVEGPEVGFEWTGYKYTATVADLTGG